MYVCRYPRTYFYTRKMYPIFKHSRAPASVFDDSMCRYECVFVGVILQGDLVYVCVCVCDFSTILL